MTVKLSDQQKKKDLLKIAELELKKIQTRAELPHLFGFPPYRWTVEYWESTGGPNRQKFLCAGNQVSKSSTQIRHAIDLATDRSKWPKFFPKRKPQTFWYVYPDAGKVQEEVMDKWEREFLPRGEMKESGDYSWKYMYRKGDIVGIHFTGTQVKIYFKTWKQDFQAGTIDAAFVDEELDPKIYEELARRLTRYGGLFSMVYTATKGYSFWYDVIEKRGKTGERFPEAHKWQVSMQHDCQFYFDGSPSPWTPERVAQEIAKCGTPAEVDKRIHGRYKNDAGLKYPSFSRERNVKPASRLDLTWLYYGGIDIGTGGPDAHPAAITITSVNKEFTKARVVRHWRGDKVKHTTTTDILNKYVEMSKGLPMTGAYYDWSSKEFYLRALAAGIPMLKAEKGQDFGTDLLNVLFKNEILDIDDIEDCEPLIVELGNLKEETNKKHAEDDSIDSCRYSVTKIPFDLDKIIAKTNFYEAEKPVIKKSTRHENHTDEARNDYAYETEIEDFNDLLGDYYDD